MGLGKGVTLQVGPALLPPLAALGIEPGMQPMLEWLAEADVHRLRWRGANGQSYVHDFARGVSGLSIEEVDLIKLKVLLSKC